MLTKTALAAVCLSVCRRTSWGIPFGRSEEREGILKEEGEREKRKRGREGSRGRAWRAREREREREGGRERKYPPGR